MAIAITSIIPSAASGDMEDIIGIYSDSNATESSRNRENRFSTTVGIRRSDKFNIVDLRSTYLINNVNVIITIYSASNYRSANAIIGWTISIIL